LYCDTDSVIFIQKDNDPAKFKTGDYLSDLTDYLEEYGSCSFVEEFVSGGPKNYAFLLFCPSNGKRATKCELNCITLNCENSKCFNYKTLRDMILEITPLVHENNPWKMNRKHGGLVVSEQEKKE